MNISAWAIRNPVAPILAFALLLLLGWQSFGRLPITQFPTIDIPRISITVAQPGAAPAEMETQVTRVVENAVAGISGVDNIGRFHDAGDRARRRRHRHVVVTR